MLALDRSESIKIPHPCAGFASDGKKSTRASSRHFLEELTHEMKPLQRQTEASLFVSTESCRLCQLHTDKRLRPYNIIFQAENQINAQ